MVGRIDLAAIGAGQLILPDHRQQALLPALRRLTPGDDALDARWFDVAAFDALRTSGGLVDLLFEELRDWGVLPRES